MRNTLVIGIIGVLLSCGGLAQANAWTTLDYPGASVTNLTGISGSKIVGYANRHGIIYDTTAQSWATLDAPGALSTEIDDIDGSIYAGKYYDASGTEHGFLYNGTNWITFNVPGDRLNIGGISGRTIAGDYRVGSTGNPCFLYDGTTFTYFTVPLGGLSNINGIDGSNLVGTYSNHSHGFFYDGITWNTLDVPSIGGTIPVLSTPMDIDGKNIVGYFQDMSQIDTTFKGFLYDGANWAIIEIPGARNTRVTGIDGTILVGYYMDTSYNTHGFSYTIPEPATALLLGLGMMLVRKNLPK